MLNNLLILGLAARLPKEARECEDSTIIRKIGPSQRTVVVVPVLTGDTVMIILAVIVVFVLIVALPLLLAWS